ncbi:MAG: hypothetical protein JWQ27_2412 [Ferruginibacter sp.]|nr:hypothetical protein [Ferruginibacter sp.]
MILVSVTHQGGDPGRPSEGLRRLVEMDACGTHQGGGSINVVKLL